MPNTPSRRTVKPAAPARPEVGLPERESRGARRRKETRSRLLMAALKLMSQKGMEGVAINEITEAADVGFGSFYNHFESKEAIYQAVVDWVFEGFADAMEGVVGEISDPAEVIAVSIRYTVMRALHEPLWGQFLIAESFSARSLDHGLAPRLLRDIRKAMAAKRLSLNDPLMGFVSVAGTTLVAISIGLQLGAAQGQQSETLKELGSNPDGLPERTATMALQVLGLGRAEAEKIANRPLPTRDLSVSGNGVGEEQLSMVRPTDSAPRKERRGTQRRTRG